MRPLLGTFVEIGVEGPVATAERAVSAAFAIVQRLHSLLSFHEATSDLTRLNQAGGAEIEVHPHTLRVLRLARGMTLTSGGLFNCTLGGAMVQKGVLPDHGGTDILPSGNAGDIQINGTRVGFKRPVKITLDGIAKGYAVDCAIAAMKRNGVNTGWVNAGGDLRVYGDMVLPVQRREANGEIIALGGLRDAALASSRISRKFDAQFPGLIIGEETLPAEGIWSVMAHRAWRADALTKVASLAGDSEREALITRLGGVVVMPQQSVH